MIQDHQQPNTTMCSSTDEIHSPVITIGIAGGSGGGKVRISPSIIHFFENYE
jgi:uridine kinase